MVAYLVAWLASWLASWQAGWLEAGDWCLGTGLEAWVLGWLAGAGNWRLVIGLRLKVGD